MHPFSRLLRQRPLPVLLLALLACLTVACGGGGGGNGGGGNGGQQTPTIKGRVFTVDPLQATVCLDQNRDGRCASDEKSGHTDAAGNYELTFPSGSTGALVAQVAEGYRLASPSSSYSTNITPFTTLVHLSGESDLPLAEDIVRDVVGLPSKFRINIDSPPGAGTLTGEVSRGIAVALTRVDAALDMAAPRALRTVAAAFPPSLSDLPVLRIDTRDGAAIDSTETTIDASYTLTNPATSSTTLILGTIRGRGHYTWGQPKNPYRVEFDKNDPGFDGLADVLGMPKNRHWTLLADYFDRSLMRNKLALALGNSSVFSDGMKWNPSSQHVEVYLNGDYIGVYLLCEDIRIAAARLNIKEMGHNDVDGGYVVEVDSHYGCSTTGTGRFLHLTPQGVPVCIHAPDDKDITGSQLDFIRNLLNKVEGDIYGSGSVESISTTSFADWYILNELFRNADANFYASDFMWKDSDAATTPADRLLNMGPIWDFDLSAGNVNYFDGWKTEGCWVNQTRVRVPNWFARLFDHSDFLNLTLTRWKQKRPAIERFVNASIETYAGRLDAAERRNYDRWPTLGLSITNYYTWATYGEEVAFLKSFLNDRMAWLDKAFASADSYKALCK